ncbi:MAG: alpha/beta fold hydrolase [Bifidobacteriaceae bacterium]|jgi:surfactin synthase thioesterase subunit|nr:alpha/beta fold hydrolase [Bifidobacteriaceae bacterium]
MSWLRTYQTAAPGATTVVALPHAGGAASFFAPWRAALPAGWGLVAAKYPAREDRFAEPPAASLAQLAASIADELTQPASLAAITGPVILFGHSLGAIVAFELAVARQAAGQQVALLAASAAGPTTSERLLTARVSQGPAGAAELARQIGALDPESAAALQNPELRDYALRIISGDLDLFQRHTLSPTILEAVPLLAIGGQDDPSTPVEEIGWWRQRTTGPFTELILPGGHFYLRQQLPAVMAALVRSATA